MPRCRSKGRYGARSASTCSGAVGRRWSRGNHAVASTAPVNATRPATTNAMRQPAAVPIAADGGSTEVLSATGAARSQSTPPQAPRRPPPYGPGYYDEPPKKRRRWVPWLIVALLLAAAGVAGWYVFSQIQDQLDASQPVAVPNVVGLKEQQAVAQITNAGFEPRVQRTSNADTPPTAGQPPAIRLRGSPSTARSGRTAPVC